MKTQTLMIMLLEYGLTASSLFYKMLPRSGILMWITTVSFHHNNLYSNLFAERNTYINQTNFLIKI